MSRASAIPELLLPSPSPSVQPCCSSTFLPKPWERGKNVTELPDKAHPHLPRTFCPLPTSKSSPPPNPHPLSTATAAFPVLPHPLPSTYPELTLVYLSKVPICCPETDPSSKPSRSRCSSHIWTESRASLSPPSREKEARVRAAQLRKAVRYRHFPQSTTQQGGRTCSFWQLSLPDKKNVVSSTLTSWMLSKDDRAEEFPAAEILQGQNFPTSLVSWGGGFSSDTFVIVDAHVHIPVIRSLLIKVCQEKESDSFGAGCGSLTQKSYLLVAQLPIFSNKMGRKRY